jgi:hypothetical protein
MSKTTPVAVATGARGDATSKLHGRPQARAALRAPRYKSWKGLHAAALSLCRKEIERKDPTFDVAAFEQEAQQRVRWRNENEPLRLWMALRDVLVAADAYLKKCPSVGDDKNIFADRLDAILSTPVIGNEITTPPLVNDLPIPELDALVRTAPSYQSYAPLRDRLSGWSESQPISGSKRRDQDVQLRKSFVDRYRERKDELWWKGLPHVRDLAIVTLLAGLIPRGVQKRQNASKDEVAGPTASEVIDAEEHSIHALLSRQRGKGKGKKSKAKPKAKGPTL